MECMFIYSELYIKDAVLVTIGNKVAASAPAVSDVAEFFVVCLVVPQWCGNVLHVATASVNLQQIVCVVCSGHQHMLGVLTAVFMCVRIHL